MTRPVTLFATRSGTRIDLRVIPRSPRSKIDGVRDGRLVVRVSAPPVDDEANEAVILELSRMLGVPRRDVRIVSGATGRNKTVEVSGLDSATVLSRLPI